MKTQYAYPKMLSEHFSFTELVHSATAEAHGIDNSPPLEFLPRLIEVAAMLERVRAKLGGVPLVVSSGYRCDRLNRLVGGQPNSDHLFGRAVDIEAPEFGSPFHVANFLAPHVTELGIGQLIYEGVRGKRWAHLSTHEVGAPVNRVITITDAGVVAGVVGIKGEDVA